MWYDKTRLCGFIEQDYLVDKKCNMGKKLCAGLTRRCGMIKQDYVV